MTAFKILIVEDHAVWQSILQERVERALDSIGCTGDIKVLKTFQEALTALDDQGPWHLMIIDIGLPREQEEKPEKQEEKLGMQLAERSHYLQVPYIVVSGISKLTTWNVRDLLKKYKAYDFFSKPDFDDDEFIKRVQEVLQVDKRTLRERILQTFSMDELHALCADIEQNLADDHISLQVNLDIVGGSSQLGKVLGLIEYLDRRGHLSYLIGAVRKARPGII